MKSLWSYRPDCEIENVSFDEDYLVFSSGSSLYCLDADARKIIWKKRMTTTFYRDPFSDVSITALDAKGPMIAAGTNFMDGKIYLFTKTGKLLWEHQFATIASLGWRPEDVTAVGIGDNFVAVGTEFIGEHIYVYTFKRERMFHKRVNGTVRAIAANRCLAVGTDEKLYVFEPDGRERFSITAQVTDVKITETGILTSSGNRVYMFSSNGKELWHKSFDCEIKQLYCNGRIYAIAGKRVVVMSESGDILKDVELEGSPVGIGGSGILTLDGNTLKMYPLP
ncbi:outer membrane protein assembly factor BamB family protein [Archaeoglobus veneficus]|uniref:Pyrrolo-quinoline quinone repeat domain-containing protein n=1 Tax=Archaeoglobus veneficus (strain DSM 11195 / SNP6) TaxID=693661 RepID=F2KMJ6_ARCVS|nr:PQQ-binding-like beta-propeller repeat protein [Archaeoglobus veneficus]AEA47193.1 hypothetical protein Arcve_1186 [Archaeoglobus veneficus SNP6]